MKYLIQRVKIKSCYYVKGNHTIEAAVILPIIFWLIAALFYYSVYLRDKIVLKASSYRITLISEEETLYSDNKSMSMKMIYGNLLILSDVKSENISLGETITVFYEAEFNIPFKVVREMLKLQENKDRIIEYTKINSIKKSSYLRKWKVLLDSVSL